LKDTSGSARRRPWPLLLRTAVTVAVLVLIFRRVDLSRVLDAVRQARPAWALLALVVCSTTFLASSWKWRGLLARLGIVRRWWMLIRLYLAGFFVSAFLPGTVGGDLVRCHMLRPASGVLRAVASVLLERLTGVVAMVTIASLAVAWDPRLATGPVLALVATALGTLALGLGAAFNRSLAVRIAYLGRRSALARPLATLYRLHRILRTFPRRSLAAAVGWSALFYVCLGTWQWCCCKAFGVEVSPLEAISVVGVVCVLTALPVSLGGLGLRQAGDVYMLGLLGVDPAKGLVISLFGQAISYVYTLVGGVFFASWRSLGAAPAAELTVASR
jgi:uncharacterized protein (TIRG00374 family)